MSVPFTPSVVIVKDSRLPIFRCQFCRLRMNLGTAMSHTCEEMLERWV